MRNIAPAKLAVAWATMFMVGTELFVFSPLLPVLAAGFIAGILVSLAQILTSIQDSAFATVPRLTVFLAALLLAMPWMLTQLMGYTSTLFGNLARFAH